MRCASTGAGIVLGNTYHLMLRPGGCAPGGLHRFMDWPGPILTDSGGFQVMSLGPLRKLDQDGVTFSSHIDGSKHRLTPERSTDIQHALDATITMCFDECPALPAAPEVIAQSMRMSMRWAARCREAFVRRPRLRPIRHHPGRHRSRTAGGERARPDRHRFRGGTPSAAWRWAKGRN
jgi:queuine tRNA-ribosyltransferase